MTPPEPAPGGPGAPNPRSWMVGDSPEEWMDFAETHRLGDGLPIIAPTPGRLASFLETAGYGGDEIVGRVPPRWGTATVEKIAINAIMAGLRGAALPVLIAVLEAVLDPHFNLFTVQVTTNPVAPVIIASGRAVALAGLDGDVGYLGPGHRGNATLGRALRMVLTNVGGAWPGDGDRATAGQPGKFGVAFAENEAKSPWEPLCRSLGISGNSAVTVVGVVSLLNHYDSVSSNAHDLLANLAETLTLRGSNSFQMGGEVLIVFSPEHAATIAKAGLTREDVQQQLYERAMVPLSRIPESLLAAIRRRRGDREGVFTDGYLRGLDSPESVLIAVAGGEGKHSVVGYSFSSLQAVSKAV